MNTSNLLQPIRFKFLETNLKKPQTDKEIIAINALSLIQKQLSGPRPDKTKLAAISEVIALTTADLLSCLEQEEAE